MTLTEFLLDRIAEDESVAREAHYDGQRWVPEEEAVVAADRDLDPLLYLDRKRDARHAANWSPARVLAECEAKRQIIEEHRNPEGTEWCLRCVEHDGEDTPYPCPTLRALATTIYTDHPDYRDEWRP
ncbi:hypothetical protein FB382_000009 [Nocardioides ginsengisegetis]|uniref:Uncharacterized protein n=2 Tax=Nocardioides ginsengisegetis TaxID=661491 RepID=A0A7W3P7T1_9ACTN|nr:DUF6221 family protein [Nocardioides ginsengisegetis]MBA8801718.1 hypothetical protein [Nocardioides ginsengisegetis]